MAMKLYATVSSERDSRAVKKGADGFLRIELTRKNKRLGQIEIRDTSDGKGTKIMFYDRLMGGQLVSVIPT